MKRGLGWKLEGFVGLFRISFFEGTLFRKPKGRPRFLGFPILSHPYLGIQGPGLSTSVRPKLPKQPGPIRSPEEQQVSTLH